MKTRKISFHADALADLTYWIKAERKTALRILKLIKAIQTNPFGGIGKPEPLKQNLKGYWSRRIDKTHRIVYQVTDTEVVIIQCRFHYEK